MHGADVEKRRRPNPVNEWYGEKQGSAGGCNAQPPAAYGEPAIRTPGVIENCGMADPLAHVTGNLTGKAKWNARGSSAPGTPAEEGRARREGEDPAAAKARPAEMAAETGFAGNFTGNVNRA